MVYVFLSLLSFFVVTPLAQASSCCGQSPASFTVLSLGQKLSVSSGFSYSQAVGRVYDDPEAFYVWTDKDREQRSMNFNLASVVSARQQIFLNTSLIQGSYRGPYGSGQAEHLSDTQLGYTYEVLPEYSFSWWRPVIYMSALVNLPTGHSFYDGSRLGEGAEVTGHNQWGAGLGVTVKKVYFPLTLTAQARSLRLWAKDFGDERVSDFYDHSVAYLANYVTDFWGLAFNGGFTSTWLTPRELSTSSEISKVSHNTTVLLGLQRSFGEAWSGQLSYADQTWLGRARNMVLNRIWTMNLNYNLF